MLMIKPITCHNCKKEVSDLPFEITWKFEAIKCEHCFEVKDKYRKYDLYNCN